MGSGFEVANPPPIPRSLVRTDMLFGELYRRIRPLFDIKTAFANRVGLSLEAYIDMVFAVLTHYLTQDQRELIDHPEKMLFNPVTFFNLQ